MTAATMEPQANLSPGETAGIITAVVGGLYAIGKGIAWLFSWRDRRQEQIEAAVQKYVGDLERRVSKSELRTQTLERENVRLEHALNQVTLAFHLIAAELARNDPKSTILIQARKLFEMAFPTPRETPEVLADLLDEIDRKTGGKANE